MLHREKDSVSINHSSLLKKTQTMFRNTGVVSKKQELCKRQHHIDRGKGTLSHRYCGYVSVST